ncbi:NHL repeat-containing protein [Catenuloplanes japonicus]|uniref:NHL repeat protein n=1 Tax=Catenuloplanes japonicus TaxID=33876 RepID=UPI000525D559|nr:NHL repeat protein [Catenuloplanes japonicus]
MTPGPLRGANGVAFGPDGRLHVAEFLAGRISAVDLATGDVEVVVPPGVVRSPDDLAFGADGSMYVADLVPGIVRRWTPGGAVTVAEGVRNPNGIATLGDRLFVNEMIPGGRLLELTADGPIVLTDGLAMGNAMQAGPDGALYYPHMLTGEVHRIAPSGGAPELVAADVHEPVAVRFGLDGVMHVLSRGAAGLVTRIDLFGTGDRTVVASGITGLDNAAVDAENRMFVSSYATGVIAELSPDGRTREVVRPGSPGPFGITVDLGGTVRAASHYRVGETLATFAHGIVSDGAETHVTSQYGQVRTIQDQDQATRVRSSALSQPLGLTVRDGDLLVAEAGAGRVVSLAPDDALTVLADGLGRPVDVAVDESGICYVSDEERGAVYRLGAGKPAVVADGLSAPQGIAFRGTSLLVVEAGRGRVLAVSPDTGEVRVEASGLALDVPTDDFDLVAHGLPGLPRPFAGVAVGPDGTAHVALNGVGSVLALPPPRG